MASIVTSTQSHGGFPYYDMEMNTQVASGVSNPCGSQAGWGSTLRGTKSIAPGMNYLSFPMSNTPPPEDNIQLAHENLQIDSSEALRKESHDFFARAPSVYTVPATQARRSQAPAVDANATQSMYSSPSMFTASSSMNSNYNSATISPLQTRFNADDGSPMFNAPYPFQGHLQEFDAHNVSPQLPYDGRPPPAKRRCDSPQTSHGGSSPGTAPSSGGRRRRSENAEPGSARAIYLEKNRKAASKCRSKQKMQQEDLVETARDVERRNRLLKAEVEMLKGGVQELMEVVSQHNDCADGRLRAYIQREADRLATGTKRGPYIPPSLPHAGSTSSAGGSGSPAATSSSSRT